MPADYDHWKKSELFKSSQKSAIARGKKAIPKSKREQELANISNRYNERLLEDMEEGYYSSACKRSASSKEASRQQPTALARLS